MEANREVTAQQIYRSPEITDLGEARELLQGGSTIGKDSSNLTQW